MSLSFDELGSQSIKVLGNGLQHIHTSNLWLTVNESDVNEDNMTCLRDGLQNIKSLYLNLSHNDIDSSGVHNFTSLKIEHSGRGKSDFII